MKKIFLLFLFLCMPLSAFSELAFFTNKEKASERRGSGFIVAAEDAGKQKLFLVTAAHVSQREGNEAFIPGHGRVKIIGRLANADRDIEILEVEYLKPTPSFRATKGESGKIEEIKWDPTESNEAFAPWQRDVALSLGGAQFVLSRVIPDPKAANLSSRKSADTIIGHIEKAGDQAYKFGTGDVLSKDEVMFRRAQDSASGNELEAYTQIQPGMSGSPLVVYQWPGIVSGVATSYEKDKMRSYFAKSSDIADLMNRYMAGDRGYTSPTRFRFAGGISYRDYGNGTLEANLERRKAGGGDGTRTDGGGGDGTRTDGGGGDGTRTDGGKFKRGRSAEYLPRAGMIYETKPTVAFSILDPSLPAPNRKIFYADKDNYEKFHNLENKRQLGFTPLALDGFEYVSALQSRLHLDPEEVDIHYAPALTLSQRCSAQGKKVFSREQEGLTIREGMIEINVYSCKGDKINLRVSQNGSINGQEFLPLVRAKGAPSGREYIIDLRRLFFDNPKKWNTSDKQKPFTAEAALTIIDPENGQEIFLDLNTSSPQPAKPMSKRKSLSVPEEAAATSAASPAQ